MSTDSRSALASWRSRPSGCRYLLFRTSWVVSAEGSNFVKTILRLAGERPSLRIVADQFGAPTSVELIADVTALAIAAASSRCFGERHLSSDASGRTSWQGLARHVVQRAIELGFQSQAGVDDIAPITTKIIRARGATTQFIAEYRCPRFCARDDPARLDGACGPGA
jgi:dTDP-4-dehydrorhamnose reductase